MFSGQTPGALDESVVVVALRGRSVRRERRPAVPAARPPVDGGRGSGLRRPLGPDAAIDAEPRNQAEVPRGEHAAHRRRRPRNLLLRRRVPPDATGRRPVRPGFWVAKERSDDARRLRVPSRLPRPRPPLDGGHPRRRDVEPLPRDPRDGERNRPRRRLHLRPRRPRHRPLRSRLPRHRRRHPRFPRSQKPRKGRHRLPKKPTRHLLPPTHHRRPRRPGRRPSPGPGRRRTSVETRVV
mmetsp:Transcript_1565/g.5373  ORF Transcript_1565/g.5373 Transcript_1565/m.5373 type:complete len:238 (-) Transcript_1565:528-1241(-)